MTITQLQPIPKMQIARIIPSPPCLTAVLPSVSVVTPVVPPTRIFSAIHEVVTAPTIVQRNLRGNPLPPLTAIPINTNTNFASKFITPDNQESINSLEARRQSPGQTVGVNNRVTLEPIGTRTAYSVSPIVRAPTPVLAVANQIVSVPVINTRLY